MARLERTVLPPGFSIPAVRRLEAADRRLGGAAAIVLAIAAGLLTAAVATRGPTTTANALLVMALGLLVGTAGGFLGRTRWVLVPLALGYIVGVEFGRRSGVGPTLDVRFDNTYGIVAFVITRGIHGLLTFLPMSFGVLLGILLARRTGRLPAPTGHRLPVGSVLVGIAAVGLAVLVAWPASTPPVIGSDGQPIAGSIAELTTVRLGGVDQAVQIRAADPDKPVLLYLSGGPGQSDLAYARVFASGWVEDFVVVDLDQRGNGKSYPAIDPLSSMTPDQAVADVIELTEYLRTRFAEEKIYLMGESWGTILGVLAVQQRPDLYYAWIGSGQMVDVEETDKRIYADLVAYARTSGDSALTAELEEIGQPPYRDIPWANSNLLAWYDYLYQPYTPSAAYQARGSASGIGLFGVLGSEYTFVEKTNVLRGLIDTFAVMYPQLYDLDFRRDAARLDVPVYILDGAAELTGRRDLALEWFEKLDAPTKQLVTYEGAAHSVAFEQADEVQRLLTKTIVPSTYGK